MDYSEQDIRQRAAKRWIADRLERVDEEPGDERVLEQVSFAAICADYARHVPKSLQWRPWRLAQALPTWCKRYQRKADDAARFATVHYAGVRIKGLNSPIRSIISYTHK